MSLFKTSRHVPCAVTLHLVRYIYRQIKSIWWSDRHIKEKSQDVHKSDYKTERQESEESGLQWIQR
jgi:hypothetical protein